MSDETKQLNKARQALVDRMLARLDAGAMPWDSGMKGVVMPYNATSKTRYRGMNALNLLLTAYERGLSDPRWLTFNQATDAGYKVKKGAKGVPIELYKIIDKRTGKDADLTAIKEETQGMTFDERQAFKRENLQTFARTFHVFNASEVVGIEPYQAPELTAADISARNERIERVIAGSQAPIFYDGNGKNFYRPSTDEIHLTARAEFKSDEFFYNTALHEMAHSTGHSSRLKRDIDGGYGSKSYAREELVAEMASVLTAAELGLDHSDRVIENSAEYVRSWAQLIRDNPQTLIDAAFDASKATDYICDSARERAQDQEKTQKESLQSNVKEWYARTYPTDELASELNANATFGSVRDAIMSGKDVYTELGSADSVVRERVFRQLADVLDLPYKSVYNAWIENSESDETRKERYERVMREDFPKDFADDYAERRPPRTTVPTDFKGRVDSVLAGTYPSGELVPVGDTPKLIQDIGFTPRVMAMKQGHLRDLLKPEHIGNGGNQHGLSREFIYGLPGEIIEPTMVFRSLSRPNDSIVIVTNKTDNHNNPIIIALAADQPGMLNRKDTLCNLVATAYGRTEFLDFIQRNCDANSIIYYDKKKSQDLADSIRVQFPQALTSLNSNVILQHFEPNVNSLEQKTQKENAANTPPKPQHTKPLMVNFYAGPSAGKTTAALELTAALKKAGYNVEYVSEYAKELVNENRADELNDQKHVTDEQYRRFDRIRNNVDIIVTDSPVLLGLVYGEGKISDEYAQQVRGYYDSFDNFNMLMTRPKDATFQTEGRVHDESQSIELDGKIKSMLDTQGVFYGSYKRDDIAKTVERIGQTYSRLYGEQKGKTQKEKAADIPPAPPKKPYEFKTNIDNIPAAMKALPNWIAFRTHEVYDEKDKKWKLKKVPITPNQPRAVSSSQYLKWADHGDPNTWSSFDNAVAFAKRWKLDGLAFAVQDSGMTCVDLDHHLVNGIPTEFAQKFIDAAGTTYAEKSVSGTGLHIFYSGQMPPGIKNVDKDIDLEAYDKQRFISMTGNLYGNATTEVLPPSDAMTGLLKDNLKRVEQHAVLPSKPLGLSDNELIELIRSKSSARDLRDFEAMWRGEDICGNRNVTDMKLCGILAFYSNGDVAQVERCFKASGLYRPPPEKSAGYVHRTAQKACDGRRAEYDPKAYAQRMNPNRKFTKPNSKPGGNGKPNGSGSGGNSGR